MAEVEKPVPTASVETQTYWANLRERRFTMPRCEACGHRWFPPSLLCPKCHSDRQSWQEVSGRGTVFSFVTFHRVYHPAFADEVPYVVAVIELEEGPRILSNIVGLPPDKVVCGMPVALHLEARGEGVLIPQFAPAE
jgi:uncharacterized OB-fold protein